MSWRERERKGKVRAGGYDQILQMRKEGKIH